MELSRHLTSSHSPEDLTTKAHRSSSLLEVQRTRKQIDQDAQLLANRIKLLRMEEARTWKKIEETRKKAKDILAAKRREEERLHRKEQVLLEKERVNTALKDRYVRMRDERRSVQGVAQQTLINHKQRAASVMKKESESQREKKKQILNYLQEQNQQKARQIQMERQRAAKKVEQHRSRKHAAVREVYNRKLSQEDYLAHRREKEVMEMERIEMELIEKLKTTQMIQQQAYDSLESAMNQERLPSLDHAGSTT